MIFSIFQFDRKKHHCSFQFALLLLVRLSKFSVGHLQFCMCVCVCVNSLFMASAYFLSVFLFLSYSYVSVLYVSQIKNLLLCIFSNINLYNK